LVERFLALETHPMARCILLFKAELIAAGLTEATINRRMSAILSLVRFARRVGATMANPEDQVDMERVRAYRDTRGITLEQARTLLGVPDRETVKGKRDYALLVLLLENALRRAEIVGLTLADCDLEGRALWIRGKGHGTQRERVTLSPHAVEALRAYIKAGGHGRGATVGGGGGVGEDRPLFVNVSPAYRGQGLTADGLFKIVKEMALYAGIKGDLSPHRLRHTAITMALDMSKGDVRKVKRLSRHARLETLQIYDDNRTDMQGEMTNELSDLLNSGTTNE
jgi:integrase/recombinase XerC